MRRVLVALLAALAAPGAVCGPDSPGPEKLWRWKEPAYRWHYSRADEPAWLERGMGLHLFRSAAALWAACGVRLEFAGETELPAGHIDGVNVAGWTATLPRRMRGITLKRSFGPVLLEADVAINVTHSELRASPLLLRKVILHEFGHALGLVHSSECTDVMSSGEVCRLPARELPQQPAAGDLQQCATRYEIDLKGN